MQKLKKYKIKPYDEVHDIYLLYKHKWFIFYTFVASGSKEKLEAHVKINEGIVIN